MSINQRFAETGFSAYSEQFPIFTTGKTIPELVNHAYEAVALFFEDMEVKVSPDNVQFEIDFKQFFQYYKVLNSKFLAVKIYIVQRLNIYALIFQFRNVRLYSQTTVHVKSSI